MIENLAQTALLKLPFNGREMMMHGSSIDKSIMSMITANNGLYEPETMLLLSKLIQPEAICLDIGANIGTMTLAMAVLALNGRVYAFEALSPNFVYLQQNVLANKLTNVESINLAVYDRQGTLVLDYVAEFAGGSFTSETDTHDHRAQQIKVPCMTLDQWIKQQKLKRLDFVKIDIEGSELRALAGAKRSLRRMKPKMIIECNSYALNLFQKSSPTTMWTVLNGIFSYIYLIGEESKLIALNSETIFDEALQWRNQDVVANLLCSFTPLNGEAPPKKWSLHKWLVQRFLPGTLQQT